MKHKLIITTSGEQIPISMPDNVSASIILPDDPTKEELLLDLTDKEFSALQEDAKTNRIPNATIKAKVIKD